MIVLQRRVYHNVIILIISRLASSGFSNSCLASRVRNGKKILKTSEYFFSIFMSNSKGKAKFIIIVGVFFHNASRIKKQIYGRNSNIFRFLPTSFENIPPWLKIIAIPFRRRKGKNLFLGFLIWIVFFYFNSLTFSALVPTHF